MECLTKAINIVSFDVPFPANYGGVIDVFYKLHWLKRAGVKIYLHCFTYGREPSEELEQLCEQVYYYKRKTGLLSAVSLLPYTVKSRQSRELEKNLLANNYPILFEVLHTCYLLKDVRFKNRKKIYRHSNIEHEYYKELARSEKRFLKKIYLHLEAWKLKRFESIINNADLILAVNQKDTDYFKIAYPKVRSVYLPSFHHNAELSIKTGKGEYVLFHGNLSVSENYESAVWLVEEVFSKISFPVIIAGLEPPVFLTRLTKKYPHINLRKSPDEEEMTQLIRDAQLHVLYTPQPTGLKLKLLNVLFKGRYVLANRNMISGTSLYENTGFIVLNTAEQFVKQINVHVNKAFSEDLVKERQALSTAFDNRINVARLLEVVFDDGR